MNTKKKNPRYLGIQRSSISKIPNRKKLDLFLRIVGESLNDESIIMDCFAGSGTTSWAANLRKRRWVGMDASKIALKTITNRKEEIGEFVLIDTKKEN